MVLSLGNILYFLFWSLNKEFLAFLGFLVFWFFSLGFGSLIPDRIWSQELGISEALQNYTSLKKIIYVIKYSTVSFSLCVLLRNAPLSILASLSRKLSIHICAAHSDKQFSCFFLSHRLMYKSSISDVEVIKENQPAKLLLSLFCFLLCFWKQLFLSFYCSFALVTAFLRCNLQFLYLKLSDCAFTL